MIAMQMTDEDVIDFSHVNRKTAKLHLCSFTAIDQKKPLMHLEYVSGWKSFGCWDGRTAPQHRQRE